jgi:D-alanyl-D-alanine carboxypeptidase/D-alanyl-D-alanine-endopeptidase (penicillin-binding protein 4)
VLWLNQTGVQAQPPAASDAAAPPKATTLPEPISTALARAHIDSDSLSLWIAPVGRDTPRLAHQAERLVHPASLMKLVTSSVALDQLGPTYVWNTGVYLDGPIDHGVLRGSLWLRGRGDPKLVHERLWLLLRQVRQLGIYDIRGDIVLDRSAFQIATVDPGAFDGERYKPYNVRPDALQLNQKALLLSLHPDPAHGVAQVSIEPPLDGVKWPATVALVPGNDCGDWRSGLQADFSDPARPRLAGRYPAGCGSKTWPLAYADPTSYNARLLSALWGELGGKLRGRVREAAVPTDWQPVFEFSSPTLAEVVRDMNKYSNNVIAQQLFLTLGLTQRGSGSWDAAREAASSRVQERAGCRADELRIDNGSGLSRDERITSHCLARVLQWAWASAWMPELVASLPVAGIETTARRAISATGRAHLKTGSLGNVAALAGYVDLPGGQRQVVVAIINHPQAASDEARAALDAVLRWMFEEKDTSP